LKRRTNNGKWVEYLRHGKDESVARFLDAITPRGRSSADLSKFPSEFRSALKRHVYALPWEDREDELQYAWISFVEWIGRRVLNVDPKVSPRQLEGLPWVENQSAIYEAMKQDIKTMFAIYWSFRQLGSARGDSLEGADKIAKLEIFSKTRDRFRKFLPWLGDSQGEQQRPIQVEYNDAVKESRTNRDEDEEGDLAMQLARKSTMTDLQEKLAPHLKSKQRNLLDVLVRQLETHGRWNVAAAAKELGVSRQIAHKYLRRIRELGGQFGLEELQRR